MNESQRDATRLSRTALASLARMLTLSANRNGTAEALALPLVALRPSSTRRAPNRNRRLPYRSRPAAADRTAAAIAPAQ